jgi:hypothetical protein
LSAAELRNHIYSFTRRYPIPTYNRKGHVNYAGDCSHITPIRIKPLKKSHRKDWATKKRCFLALTQTCREIRKEYLPIHAKHYTVEISRAHLSIYMDCFVPQDDGSRTTWVSIIAIYTGHTKTKMPTVQMLPLFALTAAIPHLTVHLTDKKHFSDLDLTNKVVPLVWHDFWQDRAEIKIMELTVGPSEVFLHASLMVRKGIGQEVEG